MAAQSIFSKSIRRIAVLALFIFALDQATKWIVLHTIYEGDELTVIPGFFNLAHRANTGAAWSLFTGNNAVLATIAIIAIVVLYRTRHHFSAHRLARATAPVLLSAGTLRNLTDPPP